MKYKAWVKRRTSHVPSPMLTNKFYCSTSFALDSARVKSTFDPSLIGRGTLGLSVTHTIAPVVAAMFIFHLQFLLARGT